MTKNIPADKAADKLLSTLAAEKENEVK